MERIEIRYDDIPQTPDKVFRIVSDDNIEDKIEKGYVIPLVNVNNAIGNVMGVAMVIPKDKKQARDYQKQLKNDLISASRGVDDGKDLRRYVSIKLNRAFRKITVWKFLQYKFRRLLGKEEKIEPFVYIVKPFEEF